METLPPPSSGNADSVEARSLPARFPWENRLGILPCFLCRTLPVHSLLARLKHQQRQPPLCRRRGDPVQARFFGSVFFYFMPCCLCQRPMSPVDFRFLRARPWRLSLRRRPVTPTASRHDLCLAWKLLL